MALLAACWIAGGNTASWEKRPSHLTLVSMDNGARISLSG